MERLFFFFFTFLVFPLVSFSIIGGDGGDLVSASYLGGNPHPPGFPLYTFLNYLLIHLLPSNILGPAYIVSLFSWFFFIINTFLSYKIIKSTTKDKLISFVATFFFAFTYPIVTYGLIPEVFSLTAFFILLFYYLFIQYIKTKKNVILYFLILCFSLGLAHHHLMILVLPSILYLYLISAPDFKQRLKKFFFDKKKLVFTVFLFFFGFSFYLYSFFAAQKNPLINWSDPKNFNGILKLITRADYGGIFSIGDYALFDLIPRLISASIFFIYLFDSLKIYGILIVFFGLIYLFRYKKTYFHFFVLSFFIILFFYFFAGIPLSYPINNGVYEKFIAVFLYLFILPYAFGLVYIKKITLQYFNKSITRIFLFLVFTIPIFLLLITNLRYQLAITRDQTAENLAKDLLSSLEKNSIIFLNQDTLLFNTQYLHLVKKYRSNDVALIHMYRLSEKSYRQKLTQTYPFVQWSALQDEFSVKTLNKFFENNQKKTIYSDIKLNIKKGNFYPAGLVWQYLTEKPKKELFVRKTTKIFARYQKINPQDIKFRNFFLRDIVRLYSDGYYYTAKYLFDNFDNDKNTRQLAKQYFSQSLFLNNRLNNRTYLAQIYLLENDCHQAEKLLLEEYQSNPLSKETAYFLMMIYDTCKKNKSEKEKFMKIYENLSKKSQLSIE